MKSSLCFLLVTFLAVGFCSCSGCVQNTESDVRKEKLISVVSYNAQEFFDAKRDGTEYSEYKKSAGWGTELYKVRLERLCKVLTTLNADIYVLQEIENEAVLQDISNFLAGESWREKDLWTYSCFAKEAGAAIGNAVISRFPLEDMKLHGMDIKSEKSKQPSVRPMLEVTVRAGNKSFRIYANHWKSKSGGEEETELWRDWQERVLADVLLAEKKSYAESTTENLDFIVCGDFNRDIRKFLLNSTTDDSEGNVLLRSSGYFDGTDPEAGIVKVHSKWLDSEGRNSTTKGSYFYNNSWERIDHIFSGGNLEITKFEPQADELWTNEKGVPEGFTLYTGKGYSDHLPVKAVIRILE
ncbi:MAG: endonuclease/exonuclease/phosphatase family protein [Treponema sp.]|nr:endonuclease/exonuclease/phosphatase family protein [Treponema sp.]